MIDSTKITMIEALQIIGGLALLYYGGDILVDGSVAIAKKMNISKAVIGLTIVAFGTSAPEFVVNINAIIENVPDIAIGNIVGSNISNTFFILGASGLAASILLDDKQIKQDIFFMVVITAVFLIFSYHQQAVGFIDGIIYLILLGIYSVKKLRWIKSNKHLHELDIEHDMKAFKAVTFVFVGITMLIAGGDITVMGAVGIAKMLNISEAVISVTIIAIGSSAPELAACVTACKKGHSEIAISNVVGSNILNIIFGLGFIALFREIPVSNKFLDFDLYFLGFSLCALLFATLFMKKIERGLAVSFVLIYITFLTIQYINA